jgi:hypothetical protein
VFSLGISDRVETANTHNLANSVSTPVIGVGVSAQDATEVCFQPEFLSSFTLLASLVNAKGLNRAGNGDMNAHIQTREGIVAAVNSLNNLMGGRLAMFFISQCVYVGGKTGRGRSINTSNVVIYSYLE